LLKYKAVEKTNTFEKNCAHRRNDRNAVRTIHLAEWRARPKNFTEEPVPERPMPAVALLVFKSSSLPARSVEFGQFYHLSAMAWQCKVSSNTRSRDEHEG
jgi:hypothetical protein